MSEEKELAKGLEEQCSVAPQPSSSEPSAAAAPAEGSSQKQNGRRKEGSGGGGGGKGAGDEGKKKDKKPHARDPRSQSPEVQLSRALAYICRHGAEKEGLTVRPDGYLPLEAVLARPRVRNIKMRPEEKNKKSPPGQEDVRAVVESNDKKRFEVTQEQEGAAWLIRAVQGHSIKEVSLGSRLSMRFSPIEIGIYPGHDTGPRRLDPRQSRSAERHSWRQGSSRRGPARHHARCLGADPIVGRPQEDEAQPHPPRKGPARLRRRHQR